MSRVSRLAAACIVLVAVHGFAADSASEASSFVVGSYNVENWLSMERRVDGELTPATPKPEKEKKAVVDVIAAHKPDILGLVEIGQSGDFDDLKERLKKAGLDYPHSEYLEGPDPDRHVALLSRFPIVERHPQKNIPIDVDGTPETFQRGILDVTIEPAEGYRLRMIGVHLKSRREVPGFDQAALRGKEAEILRAYVEGILDEDPDANILLFGDFNDTKNEYPIQHLLDGPSGKRLRDIFLHDSLGDRWTHYWRYADIYSRIDYIIVSPGLFAEINREESGIDRSDNWFQGSDHRMIYTKVLAADQ